MDMVDFNLSQDMTTNKHLNINQCWGVGSLRHCTGFPISQDEYHVPMGCCVAKWNIKTKERKIIQLHYDLITVMKKNTTNVILTVSFQGEMKLHDKNYKLLLMLKLPCDDITHGCWSSDGNFIAICSKSGMLLVYSLKTLLKHDEHCKWKCVLPQHVHIENCNDKKYDHFICCEFKENSQLLAAYQLSHSLQLYLFEKDGSILKSVKVSPLGDEATRFACMSEVHHNIVAIGLNRGIFGFYDVNSLELQTVIQTSIGCQCCVWHDSLLLTISYLSGILMMWSKDGVLLHEVKDAPTGSILSMIPLFKNNSFMIGGIMSLHQIVLSADNSQIIEKSDLSFHNVAGCGISTSDHDIVASGDMTGCLLLWKDNSALPLHKVSLSSIRSLLWFKDFLLIGLLSGELYECDTSKLLHVEVSSNEVSNHVKKIHNFFGSVICMRMNNGKNTLAVGTTTGNLCVFHIQIIDHQLSLSEIFHAEVHEAQMIDGEKRLMEIWSLAWNVADDNIATVSEDKSCIISSKTGEKLHVLTGHTSAVTSVDWKLLMGGDNILATCADDRSVRIYNGCTFDIRHVIDPIYLHGWYTLTYLCVNVKKNMLICCTENGFVIAWDLQTYNCLMKCKLHAGSVEGLVLDDKQDFIFTTSSDCVVNKFSII